MGKFNKGIPMSDEQKRKISIALTGRKTGRPAWNKGISHTEEAKRKMSIANKGKKIAENNPMWKGDNIGYNAIHNWVKLRFPKPQFCQCCNQNIPFDLANKTGIYSRDLSNWIWLCRKCHMESDGRMKNLHRNPKLEMTEEEKQEYKKAYYREWHLKHRKEQLEYMKKHWKIWYSNPENREKYLQQRKISVKKYQQQNKDKILEYHRNWSIKNRERLNEYNRNWKHQRQGAGNAES